MYNWIESTFNVSGGVSQAIAVVLALAAVLLLFSLFVFVLKRLMATSLPHPKNRQPRVAVMDSTAVDARRRLVLIRRDNVEHLILLGGPSDLVVEQQIIRSAPIVQPRTGQHTPPQHAQAHHTQPQQIAAALPGALKMPMAPGPDIPLRPDERAVQPAPPSAPQGSPPGGPSADDTPKNGTLADSARAAIALKASIPELDLPRKTPKPEPRSIEAPAQASLAEPPPAPAGPALDTSSAPAPEATPNDETPSAPPPKAPALNGLATGLRNEFAGTTKAPKAPVAAAPAVAENGPEKGADAPQPLTRAAALLRAATQNGFNRTSPATGKAANSQGPAPAETAARVGGDVPKMPGIIAPLPGAPLEASSQKGGAAETAFKSLTKTLGGRERAPQGGHSITPPASGPAARAKTALLKPVETTQTKKVEPVSAAPAAPAVVPSALRAAAAPVQDAPEIKTPDAAPATAGADRPDGAAEQTGSAPAVVSAEASDNQSPVSPQAPEAQITAKDAPARNGSSAAKDTAPAAAETAVPETPALDTPAPNTLPPETLTQPETGPSETSALPAGIPDAPEAAAASNGTVVTPENAATGPVDLDLELGDLIQTETEEAPKAVAVKPEGVATPDRPASQPQSRNKPASPGLTSSAAGRLDISAAKASDHKPPRVVQGLGDRNPIEDEMTKILNELGGQPNQ